MASLYLRVDLQQFPNIEYSCFNKSSCPLPLSFLSDSSGLWHSHHSQFGMQGGKNCGLYRFLDILLLRIIEICFADERFYDMMCVMLVIVKIYLEQIFWRMNFCFHRNFIGLKNSVKCYPKDQSLRYFD